MRTAIYTRVSKSDGSQDPENQLRKLKAFCERQGWKIIEVYTDHAGGRRSDRASFKRMMLDASKRKFDHVTFWAMDRFSRDGIEATLKYLWELESHKVGFRSYQEPFFDSAGPFKELMIAMFASFASLERAKIRSPVSLCAGSRKRWAFLPRLCKNSPELRHRVQTLLRCN